MSVVGGRCYTIQVAGFGGQGIAAEGTGTLNLSLSCLPGGGPLEIQPLGHWDADAGTAADAGAFHDVTADGETAYLAQVLDNKVHFFDISDPIRLLAALFGTPPAVIPAPTGTPGVDPTEDVNFSSPNLDLNG